MPDPKLTFDREELTVTLSGLGGGWTVGQLGELRLLDSAELQFPSIWNDYKKTVAMRIIEAQWPLGARAVLTQTLEAGVDFTGKDGTGQSMSLDNELLIHILERQTTKLDLTLKFGLEGTFERNVYEGSSQVGVGLKLWF